MGNVSPKSIFESKSFWIAFTQGLSGVLMVMLDHYPNVGYLMIAKSAIDVIIRFLTKQPVSLLNL